ncbi:MULTISPECIES: hypothetical protein [unclassified Microbacterium]|nr:MULTISPECIES: hypothetical protein [unclassified Microbacterium]|tara:strand:+ start:421 stop:1041 length:621 start_codon:yes stop_codon:yes gene_type:complete
MGFLDRLFGTEPQNRQPYAQQPAAPRPAGYPSTTPPKSEDEIAIERYRYLLRTAPPETIEQVHAEAFARLTEQQRQQVLADMTATLPASEQPRSTDPNEMARAATRAEYMNPGSMERTLGGQRQGPSFGSMVGSSLLGTVAGYVIGSALVSAFMAPVFAADAGATDPGTAEAGTDTGGDPGWADASGAGDTGFADGGFGDFGDFGF